MSIKSNPRSFILFLALLVIVFFILFRLGLLSRETPLYIAVIGPLSGQNRADGEAMIKGVEMYLEQINYRVNDRPIELLRFDDQNDPDLAREKAQEIADSQALLVPGHYSSDPALQGGEIYKAAHIPAISGSATAEAVTLENDWYFRVIFTNRLQANTLTIYLKEVLNQSGVSIIHDADSFGSSLAENFASKFLKLGGVVENTWAFNSQSDDVDAAVDRIIEDLMASREAGASGGAIFLATHAAEAEKLIVALKRNNIPDLLIGADPISDPTFPERFETYSEEVAKPGFFLDGLYAASPFIFDIVGVESQQFKSTFINKHGHTPSWTEATFYDAALVAMEALRQAEV